MKKNLKSTLQVLRDAAVTLLLAVVLYGAALWLIKELSDIHWILGAPVTLAYACGLGFGIRELRSPEARDYPINKGMGVFLISLLIGVAVAASTSRLFEVLKWASYSPEGGHTLFDFNRYYMWVFVDMLPGIDATKSLGLAAPLQPKGVVAGLPLIAFRVLVIIGLLGSLRVWWQSEPATKK